MNKSAMLRMLDRNNYAIGRLIALIQVSAWFSLLGAAPSPSAGVETL